MRSTVEKELKKLSPGRDSVVSVGVFDGVHLGHRQLIRHLVELAREKAYSSIALTFQQNPKAVLNSGNHSLYLISLEERIEIIKGLGVDMVTALSSNTNLFQMSAWEFISLLQKHLRMRGMVVGPDFALGKNREGDIKTLLAMGKEKGFFLEIVPPVLFNGEVVSSTAIRQALLKGDMLKVNGLLGRPFSLRGQVGPGTGKGTQIGFPTANIIVDAEHALPGDGVYCTKAYFNNKAYTSVTNVGFCPTLKGGSRTIEVHILDFKGDLYRKELKVEFIERLRDEKKFNSAEELCQQIARDIEKARIVL